jgi:hypothetical protein
MNRELSIQMSSISTNVVMPDSSEVIIHTPPVIIHYQVLMFVQGGQVHVSPMNLPWHIMSYSVFQYYQNHRREMDQDGRGYIYYYRHPGYEPEQIHKHPDTGEMIKMTMYSMSL